MARVCQLTGKKKVSGYRISRKGKKKRIGGIGTHITKRIKRKFYPNLKKIRIKLSNGKNKRILVSTKAIKSGKTVFYRR
jgi:large subunit ribosomal protein L28